MVSRRQALLGGAASALVLAEGLRAQSLAQRVAVLGARASALSSHKRALFLGDSTFVGVGAGSGGGPNGSRPFSAPLKARDRLIALGIPSIAETICADNNNGYTHAEWNGYRSDITITGSYSTSSLTPTLGGSLIRASAAGISLAFTTSVAVDTVDFYYPRASGFGVLGVSVDGGTVLQFSQSNGTTDFVKGTISGLNLAVHTITFSRVSGFAHGPAVVNAYNSAQYAVQIFNAGARNRASADFVVTTNPSSALPAIDRIAPHITVINLGINDFRQSGTTIATFKANMQTIINRAVAIGSSIILVVPTPINAYSTLTDAWSQAAVLLAYQQLAASNNCTLVDTPALLAGLAGANPATYDTLAAHGYMSDTLHPNANGVYDVEGYAIGDAIKTVLGL